MADDVVAFDIEELEEMAYRDLQALSKRVGIRANQKVSCCCRHCPCLLALTVLDSRPAIPLPDDAYSESGFD